MKNNVFYLTKERHFDCVAQELPKTPALEFVRVKYLYCGICGGDYSRFIGRRLQYPISLGHEFIAQIYSIGEDVPIDLQVGEFVISDFNYRCGKCFACRHNMSHFCDYLDVQKFSNRAFGDYADIHYSYLHPVSLSTDMAYLGTLIEPLSCVIYGLSKYKISNNHDSVLIYGIGGIGMLAAFYLQKVRKIQVDVYDIHKKKIYNIREAFGCGQMADRPYSLIIEATNSVSGLVSSVNHQQQPKICSFSHLYGEDINPVYEALAKQEATIYFPLRNGEHKNLINSYEMLSSFWQSSFDNLLGFYDRTAINLAFSEKEHTDSSKQIICFEDISNKNLLH